ncbi:alpha/beta fold hydrolase [Gloeothece verrucosa]|uniref:Serine aminopeptidase S33 domain-containing protein n=1 Tax=Gloeothece verrucosa (strain PCC 7822) TaxID=497965 RepID=E0ULW8_GLOV7|nr:alpha/beta hydrolase [Gloeothece verrucosa]ADN17948.1 conserved hypothetical protein [Gloeothece verrucosa PCC 7822]
MALINNHQPYFFAPNPLKKNAPLFVFLPGMDETAKELMKIQIGDLETVFDVRCFVIPADNLTDWEHLSSQAIKLTRSELEQKPQATVYLCGESFGGCLALKILQQEPELFDRIILINPASSFHRVPWLNLGSYLLPWTPKIIYDLSSILTVPCLAPLNRLSSQSRQALLKATRSAPKATAAKRLALLREFRVSENQLQKITKPVLLIASKGDLILPSLSEIKRLAPYFKDVKTITLPNSGHACLAQTNVNLRLLLQKAEFLPE